MGAATFLTRGKGKTAQEAFRKARDQEAWEHGHGGYTGTLAEKADFVMIPLPAGAEKTREAARAYADELIDKGDPRIDDKWGPAGCIECGPGEFLFFGWASS